MGAFYGARPGNARVFGMWGKRKPMLVATTAPAESASQDQPAQAAAPVSQQVHRVGDIVVVGDHTLTVLAREARQTFLLLDPNLLPVNKISHDECRPCLASSIIKS